jgi:hypothetical protein
MQQQRVQILIWTTVVLDMPHAKWTPRKVFWLTIRSLLPMKQMHTPPAPPTDGAQRAAAAAALDVQATLPGSSTAAAKQGAQPLAGAANEAHTSFPVRAADVRPQRHAQQWDCSYG